MLGLLDDQAQVAEVERYAADYPEIKSEIVSIETALEAYAEATARPTPVDVSLLAPLLAGIAAGPRPPVLSQGNLGDNITTADRQPAPSSTATTNDAPPAARPTNSGATPTPPAGPTRPLTESEKSGRGSGSNWLGWLAAGIIALLTAYLFFSNQGQVDTLTEERDSVRTELATLQEDCEATNQALANSQQQLQSLTNAATQSVLLAGTDNAPNSNALVFYNQETEQTFFRATNLPAPPAGKQYQLWGINDDGPQSLGVLALTLEQDTVLNVPYLPGVGTFAITLEDAGGKPGPDLSQLQVAGVTSS